MRLMSVCLAIVFVFGVLDPAVLIGQESKQEKITYEDHVKPIFRQHCFSCHNQNKKEGDLDLTNYTGLMQGGGSGEVIDPGSVDDSYLFALVNHDDEPAMPPEQPKIAEEKIAVLSKWIELGALENVSSKAKIKKKKTFDFALADPAVGRPSVTPVPAKLDLEPIVHTSRTTGVTALATSPWAPLVAMAGQKQVLLYDSKSRELKGVFPFPEGIISVLKFSRNGALLLAGGGRGGANGKVVVWNIKNSSDFLFSLKEPEQSIRAISEAAMREVIAQSELAPILNRDRAAIEANVRQLIQRTLDERQTGISVVRVNFNKVDPPSRQVIVTAADGAQKRVSVIDAFRDVQAAEQERDQRERQADAYANQRLAEARGAAAQLLEAAEGYRASVVNAALGEASQFSAVLAEYKEAPEVTRRRLYIETLEKVLGDVDKIIMDNGEGGQGVVPYLPLNELRKSSPGGSN